MGLAEEMQKAMMQLRGEVRAEMERIGQGAVAEAKAKGSYHDVTGNLRRSNRYTASADGLVLENTADYASNVESRGKDVLQSAQLYIRKELGK